MANAPPSSLYVTVITANGETFKGLQSYLSGAGVASHSTKSLEDDRMIPPATDAVVLFPDELDAKLVIQRIQKLRASRPRLLVVVITSMPQSLRPALLPDDHSRLPLVIPKPAFGWTILDAIREYARSPPP